MLPRRSIRLLCLIGVQCLFSIARVPAATVFVTSTADSGPGTLRSAIASVQDGDVIDVTGISGTIKLGAYDLQVTNSILILGPGPANLAIDGGGHTDVLTVNPHVNVTLSGLTITNGFLDDFAGGGIYNWGATLTVTNCAFRGNATGLGGAIYSDGYSQGPATLIVLDSTFTDNHATTGGQPYGGAIYSGNATLIVSNCTFSGNTALFGGCIVNDGSFSAHATATLLNSTFINNIATNSGGVFYNDGSMGGFAAMTLSGCIINSNQVSLGAGGGILNYGNYGTATITVSNCVLTGNLAGDGGAIRNNGFGATNTTILVVASTLHGNSATNDGGGIYSIGTGGPALVSVIATTFSSNSAAQLGGAIYNAAGASNAIATLAITNSTFSGNSAPIQGGGVLNAAASYAYATTVLRACTFNGNSSANGGAACNASSFFGNGQISIGSCIFKSGASGANLVGGAASVGYNLSSDNSSGFLNATGDQINTDPKLGPLQDNGGPTLTHAPLAGSPALDKGIRFGGLTTDQRGFPRTVELCVTNAPGGDGTDIGAVETAAPSSLITVTNTNDSGPGSLRDAILSANTCSDVNIVVFAPSAYGTITLTSGELLISNPLLISGPGPQVTINGNGASRIFNVSPNLDITISGLILTNGTNIYGGGIYNDHSTLTISNCTLSGNSAVFGGGIYNDGLQSGSATLLVRSCTFKKNFARDSGGGIFNDGEGGQAIITIVNTTFSTNSTSLGFGGGIYNAGSAGNAALYVNACTFSGNAGSLGDGNAIFNDGAGGNATTQVGNTIFQAAAAGPNLENSGGSVTSMGYNLSSDDGAGYLTGTGDQVNTDPLLGPLQDNGGQTFTYSLLAGSPALDKGKRDAVPTLVANTDQRGAARPVDLSTVANASGGDGSDIGAFEFQASAASASYLQNPQLLSNGSFQLTFTNTPGASFTVLTSTNIALPLTKWTVLGAPTEISAGQFQFVDVLATNRGQSFYTVRSP